MRLPLSRRCNQGGAVLLMAMFMMLILLVIGVSAARTALSAEKAARGERDRQIAFQAAEAALDDAERDIDSPGAAGSDRAALFERGSSAGFVDGCGAGQRNPALGLCKYVPPGGVPAWQRAALAEADGEAMRTVPFGRFTGRAIPVGRGSLPARLPRYIIELMPHARAGGDAQQRAGNFYRITAIGFGVIDSTQVVLQAFYLKAEGAA
jgi:type IV pilus assembly protein PilX